MTSASPPSERSEPFLPPVNEVSVGGSTPKGGGGSWGSPAKAGGFLHVGSFDLGDQAVEVSGDRDMVQDLEPCQ
jgi:hypothetical protein